MQLVVPTSPDNGPAGMNTLGFFTVALLQSPWITGAGRSVPELGSYSPDNILEVALASVGKSNPLRWVKWVY